LRKVAPPTTKPPPPERTVVPAIFASGGGVYAQPGAPPVGVDEAGRMYEKPQVLKRFSLLKQRNEAEKGPEPGPEPSTDGPPSLEVKIITNI
jgi:hypothetical protein